ncbi:aldose 1-epimerase family protein [Anaerobutyricum hallii]|jgi:galactose mutarotase-like enzyme|uniref:aldose 1-epimerase family protein n=1 Tax=Anaerobutyricum hallii TaxID=39488 RepID=UPI00242D469E|nr:aldose 1-epimerase family protein [Anaerobutyricum hallii]
MATCTIKNEKLSVTIAAHGAELSSIYDKANDRELVWQADPAFWNRHAPVLFPNVGKYYGGHFTYNGTDYPMGQHGFARDTEFEQVASGENFVTYRLCADEESKKVYPFDFVLEITHRLNGNRLTVEWNVKNTDDKEMYFTIGGHPAFNVNVLPDTDFEDYSLVFKEGTEKLYYVLLDAESGTAIGDKVYELELTDSKYALKKDMFDKDALVFDGGQIEWAALALPDGKPYIALESKGFPNFGIWSKPGAPYVCLEPWCGRCDNKGFEGEISEKPGIIALKAGETFKKSYDIIVY